MSITRAGGHVIGDHGWEPADLRDEPEPVEEVEEVEAEEDEPELSMLNSKAELLAAAEGLDVDESNTKAEILEALEADDE